MMIFPYYGNLDQRKNADQCRYRGASSTLAKKILDDLKETFDESYEEYLEFLYEARKKIKNGAFPREKKQSLYKEALDEKYKNSLVERNGFLSCLKSRS